MIDFVLDNFWWIAPPFVGVCAFLGIASEKQKRAERQEDLNNAIRRHPGGNHE